MREFNAPRKQHTSSSMELIYRLIIVLTIIFVLCFWTSADAAENNSSYETYVTKVCRKDCVDPELLRMAVYRSSNENNVDPSLLFAVFQVESNFRYKATNKVSGKSVGLAQIQIYWHKSKFLTSNYYDVFDNSRVGGIILAECFQRHHGNRLKALWCYNGHQKHGMKRYALKVEKIYQSIKSKKFFA